ncbi:MAG: putative cytochrome [Rhodospirillales bacterium]|nr:putative cytochrome [Rhodospirillales bacterium]
MSQAQAIDTKLTCPYQPGADERKSAAAAAASPARAKRLAKGGITIESFSLARKILRSGGTKQAGFMAELVDRATSKGAQPVLFQEGEVHQKQRTATARFFAPRIVTTRYRDVMNDLADRLIARLHKKGKVDLSDLSLDMAVAVAADIIGLADKPLDGMAARLNSFFDQGVARKISVFRKAFNAVRSNLNLLGFYWLDVKPAIDRRRKAPKEDVISHLISQGYNNQEILTECLTYGAAGMVTTREFIVMAAWHLMERDQMRADYLASDEAGQIKMLEEILRLEPIVGALYRRTQKDLTFEESGKTIHIPAGTLIDLDIRAANSDPMAAGECPFQLKPDRADTKGSAVGSMSFGDGNHRCPGATVALQETAIFLNRLLRVPNLRMAKPPKMEWNTLTVGYELRDAIVAVR